MYLCVFVSFRAGRWSTLKAKGRKRKGERKKKTIPMSFKRPKRPIRPSKRLHIKMVSCLQEQPPKITITKRRVVKHLDI